MFMEGNELILFNIIASVGSARSSYIEAIQCAKENKFDEADAKILEGDTMFQEGHKAHASLIAKEASGEAVEFSLLLVHAEDQLMSAEAFKILSQEFISVYQRIA